MEETQAAQKEAGKEEDLETLRKKRSKINEDIAPLLKPLGQLNSERAMKLIDIREATELADKIARLEDALEYYRDLQKRFIKRHPQAVYQEIFKSVLGKSEEKKKKKAKPEEKDQ